jgi:hypothetical protein
MSTPQLRELLEKLPSPRDQLLRVKAMQEELASLLRKIQQSIASQRLANQNASVDWR